MSDGAATASDQPKPKRYFKRLTREEAKEKLDKAMGPGGLDALFDRADRWSKAKLTFEKATSFAKSMGSRLAGGRVSLTIRGQRLDSCVSCPSFKTSDDGVHHFCGDCGCGDTKLATLDDDEDGGYTKLDYPYLECPRHRRGFSNYRIAFDADTAGIGDLCTLAWIAEGYRRRNIPCVFAGAKEAPSKQEILAILGQDRVDTDPEAIRSGGGASYYVRELKEVAGRRPRVEAWAEALPESPAPSRPVWKLPSESLEGAREDVARWKKDHRKVVLLFPFAEYYGRQWPEAYWVDLAFGLAGRGVYVVALSPRDLGSHWSGIYREFGRSWTRLASLMREADLTIGNDSGPCHVAGSVGAQALALMGPTSNVFLHYGTVTEMRVEKARVPCTGCFYMHSRGYRAACDVQCQALMNLLPEQVYAQAASMVGMEAR